MSRATPIQAAIEFLENDQARDLLGLHRIRVGDELMTRGDLADLLRSPSAPAIGGHRSLSAEELDLVNAIKAKAEEVRELVQRVQFAPDADGRSASIARTELQTGFMWLVRAIAKPTTF